MLCVLLLHTIHIGKVPAKLLTTDYQLVINTEAYCV